MSDVDNQTAMALADVAKAVDRLAAAVEAGNRVARSAAEIHRHGYQAVAVFSGQPAEPGETKLAALESLMGAAPLRLM